MITLMNRKEEEILMKKKNKRKPLKPHPKQFGCIRLFARPEDWVFHSAGEVSPHNVSQAEAAIEWLKRYIVWKKKS